MILGIDTGGTYTDGIIMDRDSKKILCTAKALTTPAGLAEGIRNCILSMNFQKWDQIGMVSLSTTLATNAIVEGKGGRVGLILMGDRPKGDIPAEYIVTLDGRLDIRGGVSKPLDVRQCREQTGKLAGICDAVAISGYASVRNPAMENQAAEIAVEELGLPVVCAHELTGALGFYERTVTAVLNARLLPLIKNLIQAVDRVLRELKVQAPVMIVRGNGSLMRADYAAERPVETILSGPAASVIGASFLSGYENCMVADMGGTTTDIAFLEDGRCTAVEKGAYLAGWKTCVKALDICTFGLGGDSEIRKNKEGALQIGPRRVIPFCREGSRDRKTGLTPTDILHITGEYVQWDREKAREGLKKTFPETAMYETARFLEKKISEYLAQYCRESIRICKKEETNVLVGVGAPAGVWINKAARSMGITAEVPEYAEVANAIGAAAAKVTEHAEVLIRRNKLNYSYYIYTEKNRLHALSLEEALAAARKSAAEYAAEKAKKAGALNVKIEMTEQEKKSQNNDFIEYRLSATATGYPFYSI